MEPKNRKSISWSREAGGQPGTTERGVYLVTKSGNQPGTKLPMGQPGSKGIGCGSCPHISDVCNITVIRFVLSSYLFDQTKREFGLKEHLLHHFRKNI
jgi:hypothetical protein